MEYWYKLKVWWKTAPQAKKIVVSTVGGVVGVLVVLALLG